MAGDSLNTVARRFGVSLSTVHRWVHSAGHKTRSPGFLDRIGDETRRQAVAAYLGGATLREAGRRVGVRPATVSKWVKAAGHEVRSPPPPEFNVRDAETRRRAVEAYLAGESLAVVGERFDVHRSTVADWVRAAGHRIRLAHNRREISSETRRQAVKTYLGGTSANEIGHRCGVDRKTVAAWVRAAGHEVRNVSNWKTFSHETRKLAVEAYLAGESAYGVGKRVGAGAGTVSNWVEAAGHRTRPPARRGKSRDAKTRKRAVEAYLAGVSLHTVSKRFGTSPQMISRWVKAAGHETRGSGRDSDASERRRQEAVSYYLAGNTVQATIKRFRITWVTLVRRVRAAGHEMRRDSKREKFSHATRRRAVEACLAGESTAAVGKRVGAAPATVARWVRAPGHEIDAVDQHKLSKEERQRAVRVYLDGASTAEVGRRFDVSSNTVAAWVRAAGQEMRGGSSRDKFSEETRRLAVEAYVAGESAAAVGKRFGAAPITVSNWVEAAGHRIRPPARRGKSRDAKTRKHAVEAYLSGASLEAVARRFGTASAIVSIWVKDPGHRIRFSRNRHEITGETRRQAVEYYLAGNTTDAVKKRFRITHSTFVKWVRAAGHEMRRNTKLNKISHETRRRAVEAYLAGESAETVATRHGVSAAVVSRWIRASGHGLRGALSQSKFSAAARKLAVEAHLAGENRKAVADRFGTNPSTISAWVHAAGHEVRAADQHKLSREDRQRAVRAYLDGASSDEVGKWFGVHRTTVADWVRAAGHKMRPAVRRKTRPKIRSGIVAREEPRAQYTA